ncbi:MAG TPA: class I SAM-dependent methyltransferase [Phycisphaerae bacterium]|nr:class I SAM-dependent methyltransferase [Phycisphaerae bacterium]
MAREEGRAKCRAIAGALQFYGVEPRRGAEVGVYEGDLSAALLERYPDLQLYMVDWWRAAEPDSEYRRSGDKLALLTQEEMNKARAKAMEVAHLFRPERVCVLCGESGLISVKVPDLSLDFVFVDADHTFDAVLRDLRLWVPKVRRGGIISGHDWYENRRRFELFQVPQAVRAFRAEMGLAAGRENCEECDMGGGIRRGAELTWFFQKP